MITFFAFIFIESFMSAVLMCLWFLVEKDEFPHLYISRNNQYSLKQKIFLLIALQPIYYIVYYGCVWTIKMGKWFWNDFLGGQKKAAPKNNAKQVIFSGNDISDLD